MVIAIFEKSKLITERLIDLISETNKDITFYNAVSYTDAINLLQKCKPDAVILDLKFFGNGIIELLKKIKAGNNKMVVIILFNITNEKKLKECKDHGADFIFDKYNDFEKIPSVISALRAK